MFKKLITMPLTPASAITAPADGKKGKGTKMKRILSVLCLLILMIPAAAAADDDFTNSCLYYLDVVQSHAVAEIGELVTVDVQLAGGNGPYLISYRLICDCAYQRDDFDIAAEKNGPRRTETPRYDYPERNAMSIAVVHEPTEDRQFTFTPLHKGHYIVSCFVTDPEGRMYWVDSAIILVCDETDRSNPNSEYSIAVKAVQSCVKPGMTRRQIAVALHDWLVRHVSYGDLPGHEMAFVSGRGVCTHYAQAYCFLCNYAGLHCRYVRSESMGHAWNVVWIDGQWLHVDCTWDDDDATPVNTRYLLLTSAEMAVDHTWQTYPDDVFVPYPAGNK